MSLQSAWNKYTDSCDCGHKYDNNCAHYLSNALILGGFSEIDGGKGGKKGEFRIVNGFYVCSSGRPVRAKQLRDWFVDSGKWTCHSSPKSDSINLVYQGKSAEGQGHVLLKMYKDGVSTKRGTMDLPEWPIQQYYY